VLVFDTELVDESPILDLRVRKGARRQGARIVVATSRPGALDPNAAEVLRFAPGAGEAALVALAASLDEGVRDDRELDDLARRAGSDPDALAGAAGVLGDARSVVVLWGERLSHGERGGEGVEALLALALALDLAVAEGSGLIEVPSGTNARGLREVGCVPTMGPGLASVERPGLATGEMPGAVGDEVSALLLFQADPLGTYPDREAWERALAGADFLVAFADFVDEPMADAADVVFPAETYAEKEGTITHPDGRLQRLRRAVAHPGEVRPQAGVLASLLVELMDEPPGFTTVPSVTERIAEAVPFYSGITLEELGGRGVRWQERKAASALPDAALPERPPETPPEPAEGLRLGTVRSLWTGREARHAEVLRFLEPHQRAELSVADARRLGIGSGDEVEVAADGRRVRAAAAVRDAVPTGSVFLIEGTATDSATALTNGLPRTVQVSKA
jgi:NADH-quinone oxidoreductase subunit G